MEYTEKDLSQWFDLKKQKPWEPGVYACNVKHLPGRLVYGYFDGVSFVRFEATVKDAFHRRDYGTSAICTKWRGLNHNPSAPKPKANKRKTMYVVVNVRTFRPCAAFDKVNEARDYAERVNFPVRVIRTRFRVPA